MYTSLGKGQEQLNALQRWTLCIFVSIQTPKGYMKRHNVLILSNLDTAEHLEMGIWLISNIETEGTLLRLKKEGRYKLVYLSELYVIRDNNQN